MGMYNYWLNWTNLEDPNARVYELEVDLIASVIFPSLLNFP